MVQNHPLHVLVFTDTFLETNGVGSFYRTILDWSQKTQNFFVTVVCPVRHNIDKNSVRSGVIAIRPMLPIRNPFYNHLTLGYFPQRKLDKIVDEAVGRKVIHIATSGALGVAGAILARRRHLPVVGCYHTDMQKYARLYGKSFFGLPGQWLGAKFARVCDGLAYGRCEAMCAPSASAANTTKHFFNGRVELIPNPVDIGRFRPGSTRTGRFRKKYLKHGKVLAIVVGRMAKEKNLDLICKLLGHDERIDTVFVGDGPYAPKLVKRWGARMTGFLHGDELLEAYQQADVLVQLSTTETYGLALVEALSCGLPAVALRSPGLTENLPAGMGVDVLEQEELPSLGDRCVALVSDPDRYRKYSCNARQFALQCAADDVIPRWVDLHASVAR